MNCNGKCYFCQNDKCILSKKYCFFCSTEINKISDKLGIKEHLDYVVNRNRFRINLIVSIVSLVIAFTILVVKIFNKTS